MEQNQGLRRRYRGLLRPTDRAWHRWLRSGTPRNSGSGRVLHAWRRLDVIGVYLVLSILATVLAPLLLLQGAARRPFSYRAFVLTATLFIAIGVVATYPLWTGSVTGEAREAWRDRATVTYLVLGTWIAFAYQKRSSDLTAVRELYHQWLDVQSRTVQAIVLLGTPASGVEQLRAWRGSRPDLTESISQRILSGARDAQVAIQETAHRATEVGRRASSLRLFSLNHVALEVSQMLNAQLGQLTDWQQEVVGLTSATESPSRVVESTLSEVLQACERVTRELEGWLRS